MKSARPKLGKPTSDKPLQFLGGLTAEQFLTRHWQQEPLYCAQALPNPPQIGGAELLGLACEDEIASRLVKSRGNRWELTPGPFKVRQLSRLPKRDWTILVSDLEEHLPELGQVLRQLDFLPSWRIDDLMASYAAPGGSVGPHYDSYDVFLLQVQGQRRWQISAQFDPQQVLPDCDLRILSHFEAEQEWVCNPGDLLYLPPHVAHYGVALTDCVTFSLGCRAPSLRELASHFASGVIDAIDERAHYADPGLSRTTDRHEVSEGAVNTALQILAPLWAFTPNQAAHAFASLVSQPKALFERLDLQPLSEARLRRALSGKVALQRRKGSRWLHLPQPGEVTVYVDGEPYACGNDLSFAVSLCELRTVPALTVATWLKQAPRRETLAQLLRAGQLLPASAR